MTATLPQTQSLALDSAAAPTKNRPRLPYPVRIFLLVIAIFANAFVAPMILGLPLQLAFNATGDSWPMWFYQLTAVAMKSMPTLGALLIVWLLMRHVDRRPFREAGLVFSGRSLPLSLIGIVASLIAVLVPGILLTNAGLLRPELNYVDAGSPFWTFIMAMTMGLLMQGFPEEFLWRGYGLQTMRYRPVVAFVVSGVVFGGLHYISNADQQNVSEHLIYLSAAMGFGLLAGALGVVFRSLWPAVGVHFGNHLAYYFASLFDMGTGPWLWGVEALTFLIMTAVVVVIYRKSFTSPISLER